MPPATRGAIYDKDRVASLSDGVFAISMTLLVLNLRVPETSAVPLIMVLQQMLPRIDNWLITFMVGGALWVMHHNMLAQLRCTNTLFLWLNLLFLVCISFLPYPTALVTLYPEETAAVILFSGSVGFAGLVLMSQWLYASHNGRLTTLHITPGYARLMLLLIARTPVVAALSMLLAAVHSQLALYSWLLVAVFGIILRHRSRLAKANRPGG
ncbi:MAG TPA: TMEM175 family protein [Azospirillum sp.]|nr:TMEM175 family protein [Azospirillum sp.]